MRSKHIAAIITFFATFVFSAFIALLFAAPRVYQVPPVSLSKSRPYDNRCNKRIGEKIKDFLNQDKQNGSERHRYEFSDDGEVISRSSLAAFADSTSAYANQSGNMDAGHFPRDFQAAWSEHMRAWSKYADFLQKAKNKRLSTEDLNQREDPYINDINLTWKEVLNIGRNYGADLPEGF